MMLKQIGNLAEAVSWYKRWGDVLLSNQVEVEISNIREVIAPESGVHIVGLNVPALGLALSMPDVTGYVQQTINKAPLTITYVTPKRMFPNYFMSIYNEYTTANGVPLFIPVKKRPVVLLRTVGTMLASVKTIARFEGCMFSYPQFQLNLSGNDALQFTVQASYYNYILE